MRNAKAFFPKDAQSTFERLGYSPAVRCGGFVFVSGQVGVDTNGQPVAEPEAQIRLAFSKLSDALAAAGASLEDVVEVTSLHLDLAKHEEVFQQVRTEVFPSPPYPAFTGLVEVTRLGMPGLIVEIAAVAYLGKDS